MGIPILYYHSVNDNNKRVWGFLSIPILTFKLQVRLLKLLGYYTCNWDELYDHLIGHKKLPKKTVMLQFDDGFLDNWSVVFPTIKKHKTKITIVVSQDFIEKNENKRPFVRNTSNSNINDWWGYLSEEEIREMEESGLVDIQAHGKTHTWYESEPILEDIFDGSQLLPHLYWNNNTTSKVYWLSKNLSNEVEFGYPILKHKKSLELERRYMVNEEFIDESIKAVDKKKTKEENFMIVKNIFNNYLRNDELGRYETEEEKKSRLKDELLGNKQYLEKVLNKKIEYLVFPGGGKSEEVFKLAKKYGYKLVSQGERLNDFGSKIYNVNRISATYPFKIKFLYSFLNLIFFYFQIKRGQGNKLINSISDLFRKKLGYV
jgi:peptidoglycan/xylan/chitin deacetylase (PgdA/CDA1 family)